jgi:hypothetical protein
MSRAKENQSQGKPDTHEENAVHVDLDFDFKFYASPAAQKLFSWLWQIMRWALPFLLAFSASRFSNSTPAALPLPQPTAIASPNHR